MTIKRDSSKELWRIFAAYGFSSLNLGITVFGGYYLGSLLEKNNHWQNMSIIGLLVGLVLGLTEIFLIAFKAGAKK